MLVGFKKRYGMDCNRAMPYLTGEFYSNMDKIAQAYEHWVNCIYPYLELHVLESKYQNLPYFRRFQSNRRKFEEMGIYKGNFKS